MEGRDGLNCALKAGCSTSDADTQLLGASSVDVLMDSDKQAGRRGHAGVCPDSTAPKQTEPTRKPAPETELLLLLKTQTPPGVSSCSHSQAGEFRCQGATIPPS